MQLTKAQKLMVEDGLPSSLFLTQEERKAAWDANPPKPMPSFKQPKTDDPSIIAALAEFEEQKKIKTKNRIHKMLDKKVDRTGQRWDARTARFVDDKPKEKSVISITTNTRGATKMKDYAEMTPAELVAAYNKISGKPPIKKFRDKATGLARMAELKSKKTAEAATAPKAAKAAKEPKAASENKRAAEFGCRVGSFREKLIIAFDESYRKMIPELDLLKSVYGSKNTENSGALTMVIKGAQTMIEKNKLPYTLKKEKNEAKEVSFGLFPK